MNVINSVAEPRFCVKGRNSRKGFINCRRSSIEWFDRDCKNAEDNYLHALRVFNCEKTAENHEKLAIQEKDFIKELFAKKQNYERNKNRQIENLDHKKKPQDFWCLFSKKRRRASDQISIQDFFIHFRCVATEINDVRDAEAEGLTHKTIILSVYMRIWTVSLQQRR